MFLAAQTAAEDLDTKARRNPVKEGLEIREVRESAAKDVGEALSKIDGVTRLRKGAIANDIVVRGLESNNLNVLIDGVRIYGACPGHMDPAAFHVDFAEVDSIEVTKGGADLTNQGGMGGSIAIVRKRPDPGFHLTPALQTGSFGYWNPSLLMSAGGDALQVQAGYSYRRSDPYRDGSGRTMTEIGGYLPSARNRESFEIHTGWSTVRFSPFRNQAGSVSYTRQNGGTILYPYLMMDAAYDIADRADAIYEFRDLARLSRLRLQAYYTRVRHWMTDEFRQSGAGAPLGFSMGAFAASRVSGGRGDAELARGLRFGVESYQRNWDVSGVSMMRMGSSFMKPVVSHSIPNVNTTVGGGYLDWERRLRHRATIGATARLDTANMYVRADNANPGLWQTYAGVSNPSTRNTAASANARLTYGLTDTAEAFASAGSTARFPDAQERYFNRADWVGNPALPPIRNNEVTTGVTLRRSRRYAKLLGFYSAVDNFVYLRPAAAGSTIRMYDSADARLYGIEMSYGASLGPRWMLSGGLSFVRGSKSPDPARGVYGTAIPELQPLRGRSTLRYGARAWFAEVEGTAAGAQRRVNRELLETPTAGYATVNAKVGWHARQATVTVGLDNAFDRSYYEHLSYQRDPFRNGARVPEPGRSVFVSISYRFARP